MTDGERACRIIDQLSKITDALPVPKRKKDQIRHWLMELYYCLDV